jgi:glycerophosphoryl diester phosphodiesterase
MTPPKRLRRLPPPPSGLAAPVPRVPWPRVVSVSCLRAPGARPLIAAPRCWPSRLRRPAALRPPGPPRRPRPGAREHAGRVLDRPWTLGVSTLELDIGLTADGVVVISHDTALNPDHTRDAKASGCPPRPAACPFAHAGAAAGLRRGPPAAREQVRKQFALQQAARRRAHSDAGRAVRAGAGARRHAVRFNIETKIDPTQPDETPRPNPWCARCWPRSTRRAWPIA